MATGKKRRRWLQFSLRTLLSLFLLAAGFGSGWSAHRWKQQQEVNELRETLKKLDGLSMEYIEGLDVYMLRNLPVQEKKLTPEEEERNRRLRDERIDAYNARQSFAGAKQGGKRDNGGFAGGGFGRGGFGATPGELFNEVTVEEITDFSGVSEEEPRREPE